MEAENLFPALRQRLGTDATVGLLALIESSREEWAQDVTNQSVERFERELVRQISGLRGEVREGDAALRLEMAQGSTAIRLEMRDMRHEMADQRAELLKWSFAFWFGQFVGLGGLMALLLRGIRP